LNELEAFENQEETFIKTNSRDDYVDMDYDRRQSRLLDPGMIQTLNAQMEQKTGASPRGSFKAHRKSMVAGNIRSQLRRGTVNINAASFNFMMSSKEMVSHET
jgi:hypothetical protein